MQLQYHQNVRLKLMAYNWSTSYYIYKITLVSINHVLFTPYHVSSKDIYFKGMAKCILYCQQCRQTFELSCVYQTKVLLEINTEISVEEMILYLRFASK